MQWGNRLPWILCLVALVGLLGACAGDEPEPTPMPPPDPDLDINPGRPSGTEWQIQLNNTTKSTAIPDELSPLAFGEPNCFRLKKVDAGHELEVTSVKLPFPNNVTLTVYIDVSGSFAYMRTDANGDTHLQPYDASQHGDNNYLWPDTLWTLDTGQGKSVEFVTNGQTLATPASNLETMSIYVKNPANGPCPPIEEQEEQGY